MKASVASLLVVLFLVTGCSSSDWYWYCAGRTLEQAKTDYLECKQAARREAFAAVSHEYVDRTQSPTRAPGDYSSAREGSVFDDPLDSWSVWGDTYAQNVFAGRMRQKGYQQVPHYRLPSQVRTKEFSLGAIAGR